MKPQTKRLANGGKKPATKKKKKSASLPPIKLGKYPNCLAQIMRDRKKPNGKKYSLKDIEHSVGISYPVLVDFKNQKRNNFGDRTIRDIAVFFDVTPQQLLKTYKSPPEPF